MLMNYFILFECIPEKTVNTACAEVELFILNPKSSSNTNKMSSSMSFGTAEQEDPTHIGQTLPLPLAVTPQIRFKT